MNNQKNHIKVLSTLSIASSDTREDTLSSVIIRTIYVKENIKQKDLSKKVKEEFDFVPYEEELNPLIIKLKNQDKINVEGGVLTLTDEQKVKVQNLEVSLTDEDQARFINFKNFITDVLESEISILQIKLLWSIFLKYLYDSFYEYGHEAIKTLHPHMSNGSEEDGSYEDILQKALSSLRTKDKSLVEIFKKVVERFPDFASEKDLDFLNDLAQKTLSFTSLGLKPELADNTINHNIVDWILYLDTNVLYSILGLHSHPENQASIALFNLVRSNSDYIKIKLRYTEQTYKELGKKKDDFKLLDDKMTDSSIRALLKSEELDDFSTKFYQDLLNNRDATIHPSKVIELSQRTLKEDLIEIGRTGKRLESIGDKFIESRISDYFQFVTEKNKLKEEFCKEKGIRFNEIYRSEKQIKHDVSLREIVLNSRNIKEGEELTLNNVKYFALTLDGVLISYDKANVKNYNDERSFPVFFKPSFLLNKLVKVLPIKTVDYKKAFIKAITTKGFYKNTRRSEDILKIVNYLKSKGIDDERVIYNLISEDIFLEKYKENSSNTEFNEGEFIESELNREFEKKEIQLSDTIKELELAKNNSNLINEVNQNLNAKKNELDSDLIQYKSALKKFSKRVKKLEKQDVVDKKQININFEAAEHKMKFDKAIDENTKLSKTLKREIENQIEKHKNKELKKWQNRIWWNLFWVLPLILVGFLLIIPNDFFHISKVDSDGNKDNTLGIILGVISFLLNLFFFNLIKIRFYSEREKNAKHSNIRIPDDLMKKLDDISKNDI